MDRALARVGQAHGAAPGQTHALQRLLLERDLGCVQTSVDRLSATRTHPLDGALRTAALSLTLAAAGDLEVAEHTYRPLAAGHFDGVPRGRLWLVTMAWLAEAAASVGDADACRHLDRMLESREDRLVALGGAGVAGSVIRVRGLLAGALGRQADAVALLTRAVARHRDLGLRPWEARAASELAVARRRVGDTSGADAARSHADTIAERIHLVAAGERGAGSQPAR